MAPLPDVPLSYGPMLTGVFINLILYGVFLGQALTYYQQYRRDDDAWLRYFPCKARSAPSYGRRTRSRSSSRLSSSHPQTTLTPLIRSLRAQVCFGTGGFSPWWRTATHGPNTQEEGRIFILKVKHTSERAFNQSDILRVFPIFGSFSITVAQVRRETWPLPLAQSSSSPGLLSLMTKQGDIEGLDPLTLCTQHVRTLRDALAECKRLKEIADAPPTSAAPPLTTFSWLAPYTSRRAPSLHMCLIRPPTDLRTAQTPLHMRLSAAFAGEPGHHAADFVLIRDEWIHVRVRERCSRGRRV